MATKLAVGAPLTAIALAAFYDTFRDQFKREARQVSATVRDANKDFVRPALDKAISFTNTSGSSLGYSWETAPVWLAANAVHYPLRALRYVNTDRTSSGSYSGTPSVRSSGSSYGGSYGSRSFHRSSFSRRYFKRVFRKYLKPRRKSRKKSRKSRRRKRS